jgi:hypothetical protein
MVEIPASGGVELKWHVADDHLVGNLIEIPASGGVELKMRTGW